DLLEKRILDRGTNLKNTKHDGTPNSMVAFAWFSFRVRRGCIRLLLGDLQAIESSLSALHKAQVETVDARKIGRGEHEPLSSLQTLCREWRKPFAGKFRDDSWFQQVAGLRALAEAAAKHPVKQRAAAVGAVPQSPAASRPVEME